MRDSARLWSCKVNHPENAQTLPHWTGQDSYSEPNSAYSAIHSHACLHYLHDYTIIETQHCHYYSACLFKDDDYIISSQFEFTMVGLGCVVVNDYKSHSQATYTHRGWNPI